MLRVQFVISVVVAVAVVQASRTPGDGQHAKHHHHHLVGRVVDVLPSSQRSIQQVVEAVADDGQEHSLTTICKAVEESFVGHTVDCKCLGTLLHHGTFIMNCEYAEEVCTETSTSLSCGRPQIGVSLVNGAVFSATTCMKDYRRGMLGMQDTCVFVDVCNNSEEGEELELCGCTASYGGRICGSCEICPGGKAISVDCTNVNVEAITKECQAVDLDLHLEDGHSSLSGFAPTFSGFCSELESALDNRISCDCSDAVGGTFSLTCKTNDSVCNQNVCGSVETTLTVVEGEKDTLISCVQHTNQPFEEGGLSCTSLKLGERGTISSCWATFDGSSCNRCEVCSSGKAITLDCSNVHTTAVVSECQAVNVTSSLEFIPDFPTIPTPNRIQIEPKVSTSGCVAVDWASRITAALGASWMLFSLW